MHLDDAASCTWRQTAHAAPAGAPPPLLQLYYVLQRGAAQAALLVGCGRAGLRGGLMWRMTSVDFCGSDPRVGVILWLGKDPKGKLRV
jgi:hypothetical protein